MKYFNLSILFFLVLISCSSKRTESASANEINVINDNLPEKTNTDTNQVYTFVEQMPSFPGGDSEMHIFIAENLKYPEIPDDIIMDNLKTVVRFTISKTGELRDIEPAKPQYKGTILTDSLTSVIKRMPRWIPGKQNGKNVNVYFTIPLHVSPRR